MPLDINTAPADDLDAIPSLSGHGPEIVRFRDERRGFADLRHWDEVPGLSGKPDDAARGLPTVGA